MSPEGEQAHEEAEGDEPEGDEPEEEPEAIEVEVEQRPEAMADLYLWLADRENGVRNLRIILGMFFFGLAYAVHLRGPLGPGAWALLLPLLLAGALGLKALYRRIYLRGLRRRAPWERSLRYRFTEEAIASQIGAEGAEGRARVAHRAPWSRVTRWELREGAYLLMDATRVLHWVPQGSFASREQLEAFEAMLGRRVKAPEVAAAGAPEAAPKSSGKRAIALWVVLILIFVAIYQLLAEPQP